ncbi:conserved hypothetical protein [Uncinocarpus reesii 1704]|uniref:Delta(24)-sterol reductase n=1 Tax=Uncinocarpus reesii (strain UAMH 1704) TaxID=336963 RepID=C4JWA8_UNCRE|nr:uncharacterized protein UREG_06850 [Uncinocarpus reesii 1704]EEP81985.1 conserved hypothetical protein [Uncinocarpus reesii 1704]
MEKHNESVSAIASRVKQFYQDSRPFRIYHGSTSSTRQSQHWNDNTIDVSALSNVLCIDKERRLAVVEPNVPMDKLVESTLPHGFIPPVVMEFPGITVGGGFSGTSGESSSFRHGLFEDTVVDWFMHSRVMYHALHKSGLAMQSLVQDVAVPYQQAPELLDYLDRTLSCYPLWFCPISADNHRSLWSEKTMDKIKDANGCKMLLNFGVWCPASTNRKKFVQLNRDIEHKVHQLNGFKCLYAHAYYTEDEFWSIYDQGPYDALRSKYHAGHLPSVYDKVVVDFAAEQRARDESWIVWLKSVFWSIWPLMGLYGVAHVMLRHGYMLRRGDEKKKV